MLCSGRHNRSRVVAKRRLALLLPVVLFLGLLASGVGTRNEPHDGGLRDVAATGADLYTLVSADAPTPAGTNATFTVKVRNAGAVAATATISVQLDADGAVNGTITAAGSGWSCPANSGGCTTEADAARSGGLPDLTVKVPSDSDIDSAGYLRLRATTTTIVDTVTANNSAQAQSAVVDGKKFDLAVAVSPAGMAKAGASAPFRVTVRNLGSASAPSPVRVSYSANGGANASPSPSGAGWTCPAGSGECTLSGSLGAGAVAATLTLAVPTEADLGYAEYVGVAARIVGTPDAYRDNDSGSARSPIVRNSAADLAISTSTTGPAIVGGIAKFRVRVRNQGGGAVTGPVRVRLSASGAIAASTLTETGSGWSCPGDGTECRFAGSVGAGADVSELVVSAPVSADGSSLSAVSLSAALYNNTTDNVHGNDNSDASTPVVRSQADDLALAISANGAAATTGTASFTVKIRNLGASTATGPVRVRVAATGQIASSVVTGSGSGWGCPGDGSECVYSGDVVAGDALPDLVLTVPVVDDANQPGIASMSANFPGTQGLAENDSGSSSVPIRGSVAHDLAAYVARTQPTAGGAVTTATVDVVNTGSQSTNGRTTVSVYGVPNGSTVSGTDWTCAGNHQCDYTGAIAVAATAPDLVVTMPTDQLTSADSVSVSATVVNAADTNDRNNTARSSFGIGGLPADLTVDVAGPGPVGYGVAAAFIAHVRNAGSASTGRNSVVTLSAPAGASATGTGWVCTKALTCSSGSAPAAGQQLPDLTIVVPAREADNPDPIKVAASVRSDKDGAPSNNSSYSATSSGIAPVDISVLVQPGAPAKVGEPVTAIATVSNTGFTAASGTVTVSLSSPTTGTTVAGSGWSCTSDLACSTKAGVPAGGVLPPITLTAPLRAIDPVDALQIFASVDAPADQYRRNNVGSASVGTGGVTIDLSTDLSVAGPFKSGSVTRVATVVHNTGPVATSKPVSVSLGAPFAGAVASGDGWVCTTDLACEYDDPIAAGGQAPTIALEVRTPVNTATSQSGVSANLAASEDQLPRSSSAYLVAPVLNTEGPAALALDLRRTDNSGPLLADSALTFQATVVNQSAEDVGAPTVSFSPSFGLSAVNPTGTGWTCSALSCTYSVGLAPGEQAVLNLGGALSGTAASRVFLTANATLASAAAGTSQTLPLVVAGRGVDLAPVVIAPTAAVAGTEAKFRIGVRNVGGNAATKPTEVRLNMSGPVTGSFIASGSGWRCPANGNRCVTETSASAQRSLPDLIITAPVDAEASSGAVTLSAEVDNVLDVVPEDDSSSGSVPVVGTTVADLALSASPVSPSISGGAGGFDITARNVGGSTRSGPVRIQLSYYPGDTSAVDATGTGWSCPTDDRECVYDGNVAAGVTLPVLHVTTTLNRNLLSYGYNRVTARIIGPADGVAANDTASATAPVVGTDTDLAVAATPVGTATTGGDATFKVRLSNLGATATTSPVHLSFGSSGYLADNALRATGNGWTCPPDTGECVYTPTLAGNAAAADLTLSFGVAKGISSSSGYVGLSVDIADDTDITGNNHSSARIPVTASTGADLALAIGGNGPFKYGLDNTFKVRVRNVGYAAAKGPVRVRLDANGFWNGGGLKASGSGWTCPGDGTECTYTGAVAAAASAPDLTVGFKAANDPGGNDRNSVGLSATILAADDALSDNDSNSVSQTLTRAELPVDLSVDLAADAPARRGATVDLTATVRNTGTQPAAGPVTVELGAPVSGATASGAGWTCTDLTCVRSGTVAAGGTAPGITVHLPTSDTGPASGLTTSASVSADSDPAGAKTTYAATAVGGIGVDLTVALTAPAPQPAGGNAQAFVARVLNAGWAPSSGPITVQLSPGFPGATAAGSGWVCSSQLACTHQSVVPAGAKLPDLTLTVPVPKQDSFNQDNVTASVDGGGDTLLANDTAAAGSSVGGLPVDLSVRMTAPAPVHNGEELTYQALVINTGSAAGTGIVTVALSSPYLDANASGDGWDCSSQLVCDYTGDKVPAGTQLPAISLVVSPPSANSQGGATASATLTNASDLNTRNNSSSATTSTGGIASDLIVQVSGENALVAGQTSTAVARVRNVGSSAADGRVTVDLSAPYNPVVTGDGWVCSSQLICDHDGPVAPGGALPDLIMTISVPDDAQPMTAGISAVVHNDSDQNTQNNNDSTTLPVVSLLGAGSVGSAYVALQSTSSETYAGGTSTLQLQLNGAAPIAGAPADLALTLPAGLTVVAGSATGLGTPTGSAGSPSWHVTMPAESSTYNTSVTVAVAADVAEGPISLTATLTSGEEVQEEVTASVRVVAPKLLSVNPGSVGQAKSVSVSFNGNQLQPGFAYQLVDGSTTLTATDREGTPGNVVGTFDTSSAPLGSYDARVIAPGGLMLNLPDAVRIATSRPDELDVSLQGPSRVRLNSPGNYYATVKNNGNVDAYDVPVVLTVPTGVDVTSNDTAGKAVLAAALDAITASNPGPSQISPEDAAFVKDYIATAQPTGKADPSKPRQYIMATVPYLPPGAASTTSFTVTPRKLVTAPVTATVPIDTAHYTATQQATSYDRRVTLPTAGKTSLDDALADIDCSGVYADFCAVSHSYVKGLKQADKIARNNACVSFTWVPLVNGDCSITNPLSLLSPQNVIEKLLIKKFPSLGGVKKGWGVFSFVKGLYDDLIGASDDIEDGYDDVNLGVASTDPNEIVGPTGAGARRWIRPDTTLEYTLKFENVATATAAAQRVTVTSQLPAGIDPATIKVLSAEVGGVDVPVTDAYASGHRTTTGGATLEPGRDVLFDADVDIATGGLTAHLQGPSNLDDPFTPTPYTDFLPPNVEKGKGEGSIRISAKTTSGITDGTALAAKAAITFDDHAGGPKIDTNTWTNTIDSTAPSATLAALPTTTSGAAHLAWTIHDTGSGGAGAAVYQKVDDGAFALRNVFAPGTSLDVPVTTGHTYRFTIVPVDGARNNGAETAPVTTAAVPPPAVLRNVKPPRISGTPRTDSTLTAAVGTWSPAPTGYAYQWSVGGAKIAKATRATFVVPASTVGKVITVTVTATRSGATAGTATSAGVKIAAGVLTVALAPRIVGRAKVGQTLIARAGATKPAATRTTYQWLRNGKAIGGAVRSSYKVSRLDKGKKPSVRVTYIRAGYNAVVRTAASTATVR